MKTTIISIGQKLPRWVDEGFNTYKRRMPAQCGLDLIECPVAKRTKSSDTQRLKIEEGNTLLQAVPKNNIIIGMHVIGKSYTSEGFAHKFLEYFQENQDISLLIGGPDGLSKDCLERASWLWSLSPLTLPHAMVRVIIAEQVYRAWSIINNHPYHR